MHVICVLIYYKYPLDIIYHLLPIVYYLLPIVITIQGRTVVYLVSWTELECVSAKASCTLSTHPNALCKFRGAAWAATRALK